MVTRAQQQLLAAGAMGEKGPVGLDANIRVECKRLGIIAYHVPDSRTVEAGFPDWVLIGTRGILFVEGKAQRGRLRDRQIEVRDRLAAGGVTVHVWRPEHWLDGTIRRMLREIA